MSEPPDRRLSETLLIFVLAQLDERKQIWILFTWQPAGGRRQIDRIAECVHSRIYLTAYFVQMSNVRKPIKRCAENSSGPPTALWKVS